MTPEQCANMQSDIAVTKEKVDALETRLDKVESRLCAKLDEFTEFLKRWGLIALVLIVAGDKALPLIEKILFP